MERKQVVVVQPVPLARVSRRDALHTGTIVKGITRVVVVASVVRAAGQLSGVVEMGTKRIVMLTSIAAPQEEVRFTWGAPHQGARCQQSGTVANYRISWNGSGV